MRGASRGSNWASLNSVFLKGKQMQSRNPVRSAVLLPALFAAGSSMATVPAIVGTTVTEMTTDATSIFTTVFPYAAAVLGMVIVLKLFKRFVSKA